MIVLNPGPTKTHPELGDWLRRGCESGVPSMHHRSEDFKSLFKDTKEKLFDLASIPKDFEMFLFGCASEIWEKSCESLVEKSAFIFANGEFGFRWTRCLEALKIKHFAAKSDHRFDGNLIEIIPEDCDTICLVHCETSIGFKIPPDQIRAIRLTYPEKLIILDAVSTFPIVDLDYSLADVILFSVQKCFCLPSGMGVALVSPRAIEKAQKLWDSDRPKSGFASFAVEHVFALQNMTPATPNVLNLWLLNRSVTKYISIGLRQLRQMTLEKAKFIRQSLNPLGFDDLIKNPNQQCETVLTFENFSLDCVDIKRKLREKNVYVSTGFGDLENSVLRIANFPAHTKEDYLTAFSILSEILKAC
ncbi:MAG: aminotransferase class V-fold PLP-dependent enzyme [Deltaproteobacteria bacterium]|nr:aminotransferase class V-fold PLP-dependent enzyme [Deltaproteobacteria bacterium]